MKKFVIISTQRSGSTLLVKALDKHPDIFIVGELFKENNIHNFSDKLLRNIDTNKYLQKRIFKTRSQSLQITNNFKNYSECYLKNKLKINF